MLLQITQFCDAASHIDDVNLLDSVALYGKIGDAVVVTSRTLNSATGAILLARGGADQRTQRSRWWRRSWTRRK